MFGGHFYHERIRKSVAVFGSLFNNLYVVRDGSATASLNHVRVPLSYAPADKYKQRIKQQTDLDKDRSIALKLPRMSFEMINMAYDPARQLPKTGNHTRAVTGDTTKRHQLFHSTPYNIQFQLNIFTRSMDDALQVVEQILPFFTPQYTVTVKPLDQFTDVKEDVLIVLNGVTFTDDYEGAVEDRRIITYTLDFEMKVNFYSNINNKSIIRKSINNIFEMQGNPATDSDNQASRVSVLPDPASASADSDFGFTEIIEGFEDLFATTYDLILSGQAVTNSIANVVGEQVTSISFDSGFGFNTWDAFINISGPDPAVTATAVVDSIDSNLGMIKPNIGGNLRITDSGRNYLTTPTVTFSAPPNPIIATGAATISGGRVNSLTITNPGTNYRSNPTVTIANPQTAVTNATASLTMSAGQISGITITNGGAYYDSTGSGIVATVNYQRTSEGYRDSAFEGNAANTFSRFLDSVGSSGLALTPFKKADAARGTFAFQLFVPSSGAHRSGEVKIATIHDGTGSKNKLELFTRPVGSANRMRLKVADTNNIDNNTNLAFGWNYVGVTTDLVGGNIIPKVIVNNTEEGTTAFTSTIIDLVSAAGNPKFEQTTNTGLLLDRIHLTSSEALDSAQDSNADTRFFDNFATAPSRSASLTTAVQTTNGVVTGITQPTLPVLSRGSETITIPAATKGPADFKATATATNNDSSRTVVSVSIVDSGRFYTSAPAVSFEAPDAAITATGNPILNFRRLERIVVTNRGLNYFSPPTVTVSGPSTPTNATAEPVIGSNGRISSITITNQGTNYLSTPTVTISNPIPGEEQQFTDSETVTFTLTNNINITAKVKSWNDSSNTMVIDTIRSSDNKAHDIASLAATTAIKGATSGSELIISTALEGEKGFD